MTDSSQTSLHVRQACDGDSQSLVWVVERFTPALQLQASFRVGRGLRGFYTAEDLVQDVWATALPKLGRVDLTGDGDTDRLMAHLGRTLLNLYRNLLEKRRRRSVHPELAWSDLSQALSASTSGAITRAMRGERGRILAQALDELSESDREVIVMRAIEQVPLPVVAAHLGVRPNAVSARLRRAIAHLRSRLPGTVFEDVTVS